MSKRIIGGVGIIEPEWSEVLKPAAKSLARKPKKNTEVTKFHELITSMSAWLIFAGIRQEHVSGYALEAWSVKNIVIARKWLESGLKPALDTMQEFINRQTVDYWKNLHSTFPNHADFRMLKGFQDNVRRTWAERPRFKMEKERVREEGY